MIINVKLIGLFQVGHFKQMDRIYPNGTAVQVIKSTAVKVYLQQENGNMNETVIITEDNVNLL